jgi:hypothetical protein
VRKAEEMAFAGLSDDRCTHRTLQHTIHPCSKKTAIMVVHSIFTDCAMMKEVFSRPFPKLTALERSFLHAAAFGEKVQRFSR